MDVPFMTEKTYLKIEAHFEEELKYAGESQLKRNGEEERRLAIERGQVDSEGIPWTDVFGDGQWSKRSYNQQGSALSGSAVLIGLLTQKPLFVGVRNKACYICSTTPGKEHKCYMNWTCTIYDTNGSLLTEIPVCTLQLKTCTTIIIATPRQSKKFRARTMHYGATKRTFYPSLLKLLIPLFIGIF
jgi:hypothetical protein